MTRVLEAAVGEALGEAEQVPGPGRGKKASHASNAFALSKDDRHRFRKLAQLEPGVGEKI